MTMLRARPLALLAAFALLGGSALAGCKSQPGVASYVGDSRLTDAEVERTVAMIEDDVNTSGQALPKEAFGNVRQLVVQLTVFNEIAKRYAAEKGYTLPPQDYKATAQQVGLPQGNPYVKLQTDANAYRQLLYSKSAAATPTDADLRDAFQRAVDAGVLQGATYEQVKPELAQLQAVRNGVGLRNELLNAAKRYGVSVSPRYRPVEMPLGAATTSGGQEIWLVALPLGAVDATPAVVNR